MKTLTEKYRGVLSESFSKKQFVRDARMEWPQLVNQFTGFNDAVAILKQKGMISEEDKMPEYAEFHNLSDDAVRRGIDAELEAMGLMSHDKVSLEDQAKAKEKALKNLKKDPLHYLNLMSGESNKVDKHDQMVEPNEKNKVDTFNGMKKATLKESIGDPSKLEKGDEDPDNPFGIILKVNKGKNGYEILGKEDGEGYYYFVDFKGNEMDEDDFIYEKVAKSVEDVIDPHDYVEIGQGYLKGFNRPHSLKDADLETLGRKVVKVLARGDINKAKAKFVDEVMGIDRKGNKKPEDSPSNYTKPNMEEELSDDDMKAIEKYGHPDKTVKPFKPGDMWSSDFDYEGMLEFGMKIRLNTPIATLQALYSSFEDVNYHSENSHLGMAIDAIEDGDKSEALDHIRNFKKEVKKTLVGINEGSNPNRRELEEAGAVISERVGALQEFIALIQDRAEETGFSEAEEAEEVIEALQDHYNLSEGLFDRIKAKASGAMASIGQKGKNFLSYMKGDKDAIKDPVVAKAFAKVASTAKNLQNQATGVMKDLESLFPKETLDKLPAEAQEAFKQYHATIKAAVDQSANMAQLKEVVGEEYLEEEMAPTGIGISQNQLDDLARLGAIAGVEVYVRDKDGKNVRKVDYTLTNTDFEKDPDDIDYIEEEPNEGNKFEEERLKAIKAGKKEFSVDGKTFPVKGAGEDEKKRAAMMKENIKAIIEKVLEEGTINEAATQELAKMADSYAGFDGMKGVVMSLQDIVTDIERYYDNTRGKIQKAFDAMGEVRNEEGLKVGGFLSPAVESAFNKDLRPVVKQGFTKGLDQPKVKVLSQADLDAARMGGPVAEAEPKQTVYSPVNEKKK